MAYTHVGFRIMGWVTKEEDETEDQKEKGRIQHVILDMSSEFCRFVGRLYASL